MFRRLIRLKSPPDKRVTLNIVSKNYCSLQHSQVDEQQPTTNGRKLPSVIIGSNNSTIDTAELPIDVIRRTKNCLTLHLLDRFAAKKFASLVIQDLLQTNAFVAEINPGIGLLTQELLDAGIPVVHAYEKYTEFGPYLDSLVAKYPGRLDVKPYNFLTIGKAEFLDRRINSKTMEKMFEGLQPKLWPENPSLCIVGTVPIMKFFYAFTWSLMNQFLSDYGRAALYVAILPSMSLAFDDDPNVKHFHRAKNIFLRTFYDIKKLGSLPRTALFPWEPEKPWRKRFAKYYVRDSVEMDVVKIEPKVDFFSEDFTRHDAQIFYYFLTIHLRKRNTRIIPTFEKWIPGSGPRIIREDYNIYTTFDDLTSEELLVLFKVFKSWPEYETSPFINFVETIIQNKNEEN